VAFLGASFRLGAVTLLYSFLGGDAIFFADLLVLSTMVFDALIAFEAAAGTYWARLGEGDLALD